MHVGINTLFLIPGEVGGSETYLINTLEAICRNDPDLEITLFTNLENHRYLQEKFSCFGQVQFINCHFKAKNRFVRIIREQIDLPVKAWRSGIDILWSPGYTAPFFSACPQVLTIHDMQYKRFPEDLSLLARAVTDILIRTASYRIHHFLTISSFSKSEIIRFTSIKGENIRVTYLAADHRLSCRLSQSEIAKIISRWIPEDTKYILTVANSYPHKNLHTLVDAYGLIINQIPHRLVIIGKPRLGEAYLKTSIENLQNAQRVIRIDRLDQKDLIAFYQGADLFLFPSLYEGFGLPILEAMMCGTPVITTTKASIPEVGGKNAIYVEPATAEAFSQKILDVMKWDNDYRCDFKNAAKNWAKNFSWEKTAAETVNFLLEASG